MSYFTSFGKPLFLTVYSKSGAKREASPNQGRERERERGKGRREGGKEGRKKERKKKEGKTQSECGNNGKGKS